MAFQEKNLHFVILPLMAQGHTIPLVDIARLIAKRGLTVTILTTPHNSNRFKTLIDRATSSGLDIRLINLKFPAVEVGLPEGCENLDMVPSMDDAMKFFAATAMLKEQVQKLLQHLEPSPSCFVADMFFYWATNVAVKLGIPRLLFAGTSCFSHLCMHRLFEMDLEGISSDSEHFVVPGLPDRVELCKSQIKGVFYDTNPEWIKMWDQIREAEVEAFGVVVNSFQELEFEYMNEYRNVTRKNIWCVGPVSLCNSDSSEKAARGDRASIGEHECMEWLNSHERGSVVYVSLGSISRLNTPQLMELGLGLEASNRPFIWVIRNAPDEFQTRLLEERFEERVNGRGLLIRGWAPQVLILSHKSVGGFLTHCGWNSTLEGISACVPMITWPFFAEQFFNENFIVNVIKIGVRVGVEVTVIVGEEAKAGVLVESGALKGVIDRLMDGGEEGDERRRRAKKLGEMAKSMLEEGGSSYVNLTKLIQDVIIQKENYGDRFANNASIGHEISGYN